MTSILEAVDQAICEADPVEEADAAITAFLKAAAERGWRMARDEATPNMAIKCLPQNTGRVNYRTMLEAAPRFEWDK